MPRAASVGRMPCRRLPMGKGGVAAKTKDTILKVWD